MIRPLCAEGHTIQAIPPLPYPSSSVTHLPSISLAGLPPIASSSIYPEPPHSPNGPKDKKRRLGFGKSKNKDKDRDAVSGTHYSDPPRGGDPELTLDTDLDRMEGIVDLNRGIRPLNELRGGPNFASNLTAGTTTSTRTDDSFGPWDVDHNGPSTSFGTSDGGPVVASPSHITTFTDPWASTGAGTSSTRPSSNGHGKKIGLNGHIRSVSGSRPASSPVEKRKSPFGFISPDLNISPKATVPGPNLAHASPTPANAADPAWRAPESWDVDKVAPDYSSDEEMDDGTSKIVPNILSSAGSVADTNAAALRDFGIVGLEPQSSVVGVGGIQGLKSRGVKQSNAYTGIGMIGGLGGGMFGVGYAGYGRLRTKSDAYPAGGPPGSSQSMAHGSAAMVRKESWVDSDNLMSRRPSDALSHSPSSRNPLPSV